MKIQTQAVNILETASNALKSGLLKEKPVWYDIILKYPPKHNLIKKPHQPKTNSSDPRNDEIVKNFKIPKDIHKIPKLKFIEDTIRDTFYKHHPWELARPKNLIEINGDEILKKCNWKNMLQLYKPLDGESVVQRTMYLIKNNKNLSIFDAYDLSRMEFYKLRMFEEMQSHISKEESIMNGAIIELNYLKQQMEKENEYLKQWIIQGMKQTKILEASSNKSSQVPVGSIIENDINQTSLFEDLVNLDK
ncbi:unnamed protein product [Candida verbasci]|uniref:37S ribosomal protein S25, mitochondrial n=1 Tax=Candida verbasci TaxID=1227364 RepID=A0A9W4TSK7_9ASCO|nr:unnamed protein product [Candida verbasci]